MINETMSEEINEFQFLISLVILQKNVLSTWRKFIDNSLLNIAIKTNLQKERDISQNLFK